VSPLSKLIKCTAAIFGQLKPISHITFGTLISIYLQKEKRSFLIGTNALYCWEKLTKISANKNRPFISTSTTLFGSLIDQVSKVFRVMQAGAV
jgi:hypothetical protein